MNIEHFEDEFPDFYVDFGYKMNPSPSPMYPELLAEENYDMIIEKATKENLPDSYYVKLTWKTLEVGTWECTPYEHDYQMIPQKVVEVAKSYKPPVFD